MDLRFDGNSSIFALRGWKTCKRRVDLAFAELEVIEEMLRPLVTVRELHQSEDLEVRFPVTQTKEFQLFGRWLEQRVGQCKSRLFRG